MKSSLFTFCHLTRKSDQKTCLCRWCPQDQDPRLMLLLKSQNVNALQITAKYYNAKIWPFIVFIDNCVEECFLTETLYELHLKDDYLIVLWHTNHIMDSHFFANTKFAEGRRPPSLLQHASLHFSYLYHQQKRMWNQSQ